MNFNPELKASIPAYFSYVIIIEGKKKIPLLEKVGFKKVYSLHEDGMSIRVRIEQIMQQIDKKDKICILTDFDKKGKDLYMLAKPIFQELGANLDSSFRGLLLKGQLKHIEEITKFFEKLNKIG